ncbi:MAG: nodulation protein NfeD [SAR202 cluster bacterium]|nr:nodulation protein NfeD [SAR202 cluster bacterium]|tara:strand:+ start:2175 stop:3518 length:1344 start_codon:yes stop_codon:yes gene_type:complete
MRVNLNSLKVLVSTICIAVAILLIFAQITSAQENKPYAATVSISGMIDKAEARILDKSIRTAYETNASLIILLINTPGGDLESTRKMVASIYSSKIPVITYVWPSGSQAASAGTFLLAAGHFAVMAPSTNVGAATPVSITGEDLPPTISNKATQDASSFLRSIAKNRGHNVDAYETTVTQSKSYTEIEAIDAGLINMISVDTEQLLKKIDGKTIQIDQVDLILDTSNLEIQTIKPLFLDRFLQFLSNPNIALILLAIGFIGILIELINPGGFVAGITGIAAIILALVALGNLPVNWMGMLLIGFAGILFYIEVQVSGLGIAGLIGGALFIVGSILLFGGFSEPDINGPGFMANTWILVVISTIIGLAIIILVKSSLDAKKNQYRTHERVSLGQVAKTITDLNPEGTVYISGEEWSAVSETGSLIESNSSVVITNKDKLILKVRKTDL